MLSLLVSITEGNDEERLQKAVDYYVKRYGNKPQECNVNRKTLSDDFKSKSYHGVAIVFDDKLKVGDFALVVE